MNERRKILSNKTDYRIKKNGINAFSCILNLATTCYNLYTHNRLRNVLLYELHAQKSVKVAYTFISQIVWCKVNN